LKTFSSSDSWDRHLEACWRDTLEVAREYGWTLTTFSGHSWGKIECPTGACNFIIFSTARSTESAAKDARRRVERCPHGAGSGRSVADTDGLLLKASRLVDAAEQLALRGKAQAAAEMLDEADGVIESEATWDDFNRLLAEAEEHDSAANAAFLASGEHHESSGDALDSAERHVQTAREELATPRLPAADVKRLRLSVSDLKGRIKAVRVDLPPQER